MNASIERLIEMPREMTISQAAYVLGRSDDFVERAINTNPARIESRADEGRGTGRRNSHIITREALLVYIVRTTRGDRLTLMSAIEQRLPKALLDLAQRIACGVKELPPQPSSEARRKIIPHPALKNHPEFPFAASLHTEAQQSA